MRHARCSYLLLRPGLRIALLVVVAFLVAGCASGLGGPSETTGDITGTWVGTATRAGNPARGANLPIDAILQAQQSGAVITGTLQIVAHPEISGALTGTRNGNVVVFTITGGGRGSFFLYGNQLTGDIGGLSLRLYRRT
jgi:hypothetical protein